MKKFKMLSAAALALILGACSSDAPEVPAAAVNGGDCYLTFSLGNVATRADAFNRTDNSQDGTAAETTINSLTFFFFTEGNNPIYSNTVKSVSALSETDDEGYDQTKKVAQVKIDSDKFTALSAYKGKTIKYFFICNDESLKSTNPTVADLTDKYFSGTTLPSAAGSFVMTGSGTIEVTEPGTAGDSWNNAWAISDTALEVQRVNARFDYQNTAAEEMATENQQVKLSYVAAKAFGFNDNIYYFPHYGKGGAAVDFSKPTSSVINPDATNGWTLLYSYAYSAPANAWQLAFENSAAKVSEYWNPLTMSLNDAAYKDLTYIVFKYNITSMNALPADFQDSWGKTLYVKDGVLIGDCNDLNTYNGSEVDPVTLHMWYREAADATDGSEAAIDNYLITKFKGGKQLRVFTYSVDKGYEVYYFHAVQRNAITTDKKTDNHYYVYGVQRNDIYEIKAANLKLFGYPGDYVPGKLVEEQTDNYFKMSINVKKWNVVKNTYDLD